MFTKEELSRIPEDLRPRIEKINSSHYLSAYLSILKQKESWEKEMQENPFTIRAQVINDDEGVKESNRQDSETALKIIKILPELAESLNELYAKLTSQEKEQVDYASDAKEIQKKVLGLTKAGTTKKK
jgi:hypothetical protein